MLCQQHEKLGFPLYCQHCAKEESRAEIERLTAALVEEVKRPGCRYCEAHDKAVLDLSGKLSVANLQIRDYQTALQTIGDWDHHDLCDRRDPMIKTKPCNCFVKIAGEVLAKYKAGRCADCGTPMDVHPDKDCTV